MLYLLIPSNSFVCIMKISNSNDTQQDWSRWHIHVTPINHKAHKQISDLFCFPESEREKNLARMRCHWHTEKQYTIIRFYTTNQGNTQCRRELNLTPCGRYALPINQPVISYSALWKSKKRLKGKNTLHTMSLECNSFCSMRFNTYVF